ncbi:MAG: thermostable hemolysin [Thiotrichales bacterium]|nr:thermostable hemolysin [Thiotrichales bacterium]
MATQRPKHGNTSLAVVKTMGLLVADNSNFDVYIDSTPERQLLETYISDQFFSIYEAKLHDFMPLLLSLRHENKFCSAAGVRPAISHKLFLEQYLPQSIEVILSQKTEHTVTRQQIAEIGNLASTKPGGSQLLFIALTAMLEATELEWVTFTATLPVQKAIGRLGIPLYPLHDSNPKLLKHSPLSDWGSYYEQKPKVVAAKLSQALQVLKKQPAYNQVLHCYKNRFNTLSTLINPKRKSDGKSAYAA